MIHYVIGPSAAGKSTYVHATAAEGDIIVDFDALCKILGSPEHHDPPAHIRSAAAAARQAIEGAISDGLPGDQWVIRSYLRDEAISRMSGQGIKFVLVDPGKETAIEQAKADDRPAGTIERIERWYQNPPVFPDGADVEVIDGTQTTTPDASSLLREWGRR